MVELATKELEDYKLPEVILLWVASGVSVFEPSSLPGRKDHKKRNMYLNEYGLFTTIPPAVGLNNAASCSFENVMANPTKELCCQKFEI